MTPSLSGRAPLDSPRIPGRRLFYIALALVGTAGLWLGCSGSDDGRPPAAAGTTSAGSAGGDVGVDSCETPSDCPAGTPCERYECLNDVCVLTLAFEGKVVNESPSDCMKVICGASGEVEYEGPDDAEIPSDENDCTEDTCSGGVPGHAMRADGTACEGGTKVCLSGACEPSPCSAAADCPPGPLCYSPSCDGGQCVYSLSPADTEADDVSSTDCVRVVCDGSGSVEVEDDPDDVPDDNNECTIDSCFFDGTPLHTGKENGTSCGAGGYCYGGVCSQCATMDHCPSLPCKEVWACSKGNCAYTNATNGTPCGALKFCQDGACR